jgi:DNA-binding beta-propeller fold protein YncE
VSARSACLAAAACLSLAACGGDDSCDVGEAGTICTIAGTGENGYSGDDGPALEAEMSLPQDTLLAPNGSLYILDWNNHRIRKLTPDGEMEHVAGSGELGGTLDDPANSDFNHPTGIILDPTGRYLVVAAWHNSQVTTIDLEGGDLVDICGDGRRAYFGDGGPAAEATLDLPASIAFDADDNLVIMDQANQVIRRIDSEGIIERIAGQCVLDRPPPEGPGPCESPVPCPGGSGKLTCGDPDATCGAGACSPAYGGDGGDALEMRMAQPFGQSADPAGRIAYDAEGGLLFADTSNAIIRRIDPDGVVTRIAGLAPEDGVAQTGYAGDGGPADKALLNQPVDLAVADDGTVYFSDVSNHCIRAIAPDGTISTAVGRCGERGYEGDGGPASEALLLLPYGVEWARGTLYIADSGNSVIRAVEME